MSGERPAARGVQCVGWWQWLCWRPQCLSSKFWKMCDVDFSFTVLTPPQNLLVEISDGINHIGYASHSYSSVSIQGGRGNICLVTWGSIVWWGWVLLVLWWLKFVYLQFFARSYNDFPGLVSSHLWYRSCNMLGGYSGDLGWEASGSGFKVCLSQ